LFTHTLRNSLLPSFSVSLHADPLSFYTTGLRYPLARAHVRPLSRRKLRVQGSWLNRKVFTGTRYACVQPRHIWEYRYLNLRTDSYVLKAHPTKTSILKLLIWLALFRGLCRSAVRSKRSSRSSLRKQVYFIERRFTDLPVKRPHFKLFRVPTFDATSSPRRMFDFSVLSALPSHSLGPTHSFDPLTPTTRRVSTLSVKHKTLTSPSSVFPEAPLRGALLALILATSPQVLRRTAHVTCASCGQRRSCSCMRSSTSSLWYWFSLHQLERGATTTSKSIEFCW